MSRIIYKNTLTQFTLNKLFERLLSMLHIFLCGHNYEYEITDIVKLFYNDKNIVFISDEPSSIQGLFLLSQVKACNYIETKLYDNGICIGQNKEICFEEQIKDKKQLKKAIKKSVYSVLSAYNNKKLPWGILTGIRPAKLVHELLDKGKSKDEIFNILKEDYFISDKKFELVYAVAQRERGVMQGTDGDMVSIYIAIPFCITRCIYCSFSSYLIDKYASLVNTYINALIKEIDYVSEYLRSKRIMIQSLYVGGGTPSSLNSNQLDKLLSYIQQSFDLSYIKEFTFEAGRPDTIDEEKLSIIKKHMVSRISINPQTMNNNTLKLIGRKHTADDIIEKFLLARSAGFDNINMDLIAGLPKENITMFKETLKQIEALCPESVTVHTLSIKRASLLMESKSHFFLSGEDMINEMMDTAYDRLNAMKLYPYYLYRQKNILGNLENIGFAKEGYDSIYNIQIMEERQSILALGAGATTKLVYPEENRIERVFNVKSPEEYISRIDEMIDRKRKLMF